MKVQFAPAACHVKIPHHVPNTLCFANVAIADLPTLEREARVVATRNAFIIRRLQSATTRYENGCCIGEMPCNKSVGSEESFGRTSRIKYHI